MAARSGRSYQRRKARGIAALRKRRLRATHMTFTSMVAAKAGTKPGSARWISAASATHAASPAARLGKVACRCAIAA